MPRHPVSTELLLAFLANELPADERDRIARHAASCAECAATVARFGRVRDVMRADSGEAPAAVIARAKAIYRPVLATVPAPQKYVQPAVRRNPFQLRMAFAFAAVLLLIFLGGGTQVLAASADALPGDTLYPVKTGVEELQTALARDPGDEITVRLEIVRTREKEIRQLQQLGRSERIAETVAASQAQIERVSDLLERLASQDKQRAATMAAAADEALSVHILVLTEVLANAPAPAQAGLQNAIQKSEQARSDAAPIKATPTGKPPAAGTPAPPALTAAPSRPANAGQPATPPGNSGNAQATRTPPANAGPPATPPGNSGNAQATHTPPANAGPPATPPGNSGNGGPPATPPGNSGNAQATHTPPGKP